ncbi:hypothetical protein ABER23_22965 [Paenibacillus lautus]|uniref:hypothetical protein n=1 Tax=Paenibacillus lautus TaxID=1401 RepID=UPI003D26CEB2
MKNKEICPALWADLFLYGFGTTDGERHHNGAAAVFVASTLGCEVKTAMRKWTDYNKITQERPYG